MGRQLAQRCAVARPREALDPPALLEAATEVVATAAAAVVVVDAVEEGGEIEALSGPALKAFRYKCLLGGSLTPFK